MEMIVDLCLGGQWDKLPASSPAAHNHSTTTVFPDVVVCQSTAKLVPNDHILNTSGVLQVGGLAHPLPSIIVGRDPMLPHPPHFRGCIKNLRINGKASLRILRYRHGRMKEVIANLVSYVVLF